MHFLQKILSIILFLLLILFRRSSTDVALHTISLLLLVLPHTHILFSLLYLAPALFIFFLPLSLFRHFLSLYPPPTTTTYFLTFSRSLSAAIDVDDDDDDDNDDDGDIIMILSSYVLVRQRAHLYL